MKIQRKEKKKAGKGREGCVAKMPSTFLLQGLCPCWLFRKGKKREEDRDRKNFLPFFLFYSLLSKQISPSLCH
jgi:hypothetical protein